MASESVTVYNSLIFKPSIEQKLAMLKTFVINLAGSEERWETTSKRLTELKVPFERFEAVDGRVLPHPLFERHDDKLRQKYRGRALSGGELGCFTSHFLLWQRCVELNEPIVVMEDDVVINESFKEAIDIAGLHIDDLRYLRLAGTYLKRHPYKKVKTIGVFDLNDHIKGPSGALCYVVNPSAAKAFLAQADSWFLAVDDYMDHYWWHSVDCFSLMPFPITVGDNSSDIPRPKKVSLPLWKKIRKEVYSLIEHVKRYWYRLNN
jgi:glycosyl transferase family 25